MRGTRVGSIDHQSGARGRLVLGHGSPCRPHRCQWASRASLTPAAFFSTHSSRPFFSAEALNRRSCNSSMSCSSVAFLERGFFMGLDRRDRHRSASTSSRPLAADVARSRLLSRLARLRLRCAQDARAGVLDLPVRVNLHSAEEWRRGAELRLGARAFVLLQPLRDDVRGGMRGSLQ
jgi:hypothetical protein